MKAPRAAAKISAFLFTLFFLLHASASPALAGSFSDSYTDSSNINGSASSGHKVSNGQLKIKDPVWYSSSWSRRKAITITNNTASTLTNFQVELTVSYDTDMQADFDDLRFTNSSGTLLDHWTESYTASTSATVWVEVDSIPASSSTTIYMYYGNGSASSASNGANTFPFFDDFEDGSISDWTTYSSGTVNIDSTQAYHGTYSIRKDTNNDPHGGYKTFTSIGLDYVLEGWMRRNTGYAGGDQDRVAVENSSFNGYGIRVNHNGNLTEIEERTGGSSAADLGSTVSWDPPENVWYRFKFQMRSGGNFDVYYYNTSGTLLSSATGRTDTTTSSFDRFVIHGGYEFYLDDLRIRKYASSDPSSSFGSEQQYPPPATIESTNLLSGEGGTVDTIDEFVYNLSSKPSGTSATVQFSQNGTTWVNSAGTVDGTDTLTTGANNTIVLNTLGWSGANFYYKIKLTGNGTSTPTLDDVTVNYTTSGTCTPPLGGDFTLDMNCPFNDTNSDGVDNGNLTIPQYKTLTINAGQTVAWNPGKSIIIQDGASIVINTTGQLKQTYIWMIDADGDGYPSTTTQYVQDSAPANGRRRYLMASLSEADCDDTTYSGTNSCVARRDITISYSGSTLTDYDVLVQFDTATEIGQGEMQTDCGDLRFYDSDGSTTLTYWIEGGCNTSNTQIWVRVPSIPDGGKTIYMDYNDAGAADGFQSWSGSFSLLYNASCPAGWSRNTSLDSRFPYGSNSYGTTGGSDTHSHGALSCGSGNKSPNQAVYGSGSGATGAGLHHHGTLSTSALSTESNVPSYLDVVYCSASDLVIPANFISIFDTTSLPSGWTRFTALDSKFPRGAATYGGTGGASTHTHTYTGNGTAGAINNLFNGSGFYDSTSTSGHSHTVNNGTTNAATHTPPYLDVVYGQAGSQTVGQAGMITIVSALPPLGWTQFSALDSKFPRGAATYGGTGGASTHTHTETLSTGGASSTNEIASYTVNNGTTGSHGHQCSATSDSRSNLPAYLNVIFVQRNTPAATTSVGPE